MEDLGDGIGGKRHYLLPMHTCYPTISKRLGIRPTPRYCEPPTTLCRTVGVAGHCPVCLTGSSEEHHRYRCGFELDQKIVFTSCEKRLTYLQYRCKHETCLNLLAKEVKKRVVPRVRTMEKFQNDVLVMKISQVFLLFGVYIFLMLVDCKLEDPLRSKDIGRAVIAVRHEGTRPSCNKGTAKNYEKAETRGKEKEMEQKRERGPSSPSSLALGFAIIVKQNLPTTFQILCQPSIKLGREILRYSRLADESSKKKPDVPYEIKIVITEKEDDVKTSAENFNYVRRRNPTIGSDCQAQKHAEDDVPCLSPSK
uniref:Uncharacterized protein n=1 Tax=Vespula pensylvanica TaxID=30213 RepID=A0A834NQ92_VESPE|nr:hypothetical protein H0235_012156 [Vespula pensylvanica]